MARMGANTPLCHSEHSLCHSERSEESHGEKGKEILRFALNDKVMVNGQLSIVMCPNAEEHPPLPPFKGGKSEAKRWETGRPLGGGLKA